MRRAARTGPRMGGGYCGGYYGLMLGHCDDVYAPPHDLQAECPPLCPALHDGASP